MTSLTDWNSLACFQYMTQTQSRNALCLCHFSSANIVKFSVGGSSKVTLVNHQNVSSTTSVISNTDKQFLVFMINHFTTQDANISFILVPSLSRARGNLSFSLLHSTGNVTSTFSPVLSRSLASRSQVVLSVSLLALFDLPEPEPLV